jgi:hypothetical protein
MASLRFWLFVALGSLIGAGCTEPAEPTCAAGATQQCWCLDGQAGAQICADDGARWGECQCAAPDGDADCDVDGDADADSDGFDVRLEGAVAKGPFVVGSLVVVALIDAEGNPTGAAFMTHTINDLGEFELELRIPQFASLEGTGFYYNELTGELSDSAITLQAFYEAEAGGLQEAYVNIITHLAYGRVRTLLLAGADFETAIRQAERALRRDLGVGPAGFDPGGAGIEMNVLGGDTDANAYLLAVSSVLAQAAALRAGEARSIDSALQELINALMGDLEDDGEITAEHQAELRAAEAALDPVAVMDLLGARLLELGSDAEIPDIRRIIDRDDDGVVNADDCDDTDPGIYPGASERCNGLDDDCDGEVPEDQDGDGYADTACGGDDCDDLDETRHPGMPDVCGDDIDADCQGDPDLPVLGEWAGDCVIAAATDVARVRGYSTISGNLVVGSTMTHLVGMECLDAVVGSVSIEDNAGITSVIGLQGLTSVGGFLLLSDLDSLATFDGLDGLSRIGGYLTIEENATLDSLAGLDGVTVIGGDLTIYTNRELRNLDALSGLTSVESVIINNNFSLANVDGLEGLGAVATLTIADNDQLEDLEGLRGVETISGLLYLSSNPRLTDVDGLRSLTEVGGLVTIRDNDALLDLDGLSGLMEAGEGLVIQDNASLPTCEAEELLQRLRDHGWTGLAAIAGNDDEGSCE